MTRLEAIYDVIKWYDNGKFVYSPMLNGPYAITALDRIRDILHNGCYVPLPGPLTIGVDQTDMNYIKSLPPPNPAAQCCIHGCMLRRSLPNSITHQCAAHIYPGTPYVDWSINDASI